MELKTFRSMWCAPSDLGELIAESSDAGFDGIEGPIPEQPLLRSEFKARLSDAGLAFIAECTTAPAGEKAANWWVPDPYASLERHLEDLRITCGQSSEFGARFVTTMCGYDGWSYSQNLDFFARALELQGEMGIAISFETHRTRSLYNPWITRDLLVELPALRLTCDLSHWCVVCERLLDGLEDVLERVANHAFHLHGRVGHAQGAQVADPRDPAHAEALAAHEGWWDQIWKAQEERGMEGTTLTPEFGAEGYLQTLPYTSQPVADLWEVIQWMGHRQRERFANR